MDAKDLIIVPLTVAHVQGCLRLSTDAGWNQTAEDWHFQLENGSGFGIMSGSATVVATGVALAATPDLQWISMILVDAHFRRLGLGRRIMETLLSANPHCNHALDATDLGRGLYDSVGFRPVEHIIRYRRPRSGEVVLALDGRSGLDDRRLDPIAVKLRKRVDVAAETYGSACGLARPGRTAVHIGPLLANSETDAEALSAHIQDNSSGDVLLDAPARAGTFCRRLERMGFERERSFVRMSRGRSVLVKPGTFGIAGPEYG